MEAEEKVLEAVRIPQTQIDIAKRTGLPREEIRKAIRRLERKGLIVSRGSTAARRHMSLVAAVEVLFDEVDELRRSFMR